ncbi:hypothetical protein D3C81_1311490 [compost metagenome]
MQAIDHTNEALEEVIAVDGLAIESLFPARAKFGVLLQESSLLNEKLFVFLSEI